ncbi:MAG: hypothetical protein NC086_03915 [Alistipes sp.]|nr:hypothetical protein [Alistipes sp.]
MDIRELFLYQLWDTFLAHIHGVADTPSWVVTLQLIIGIFLPLMTLYRLMKRRSIVERVICCMVPFVLIATTAIMEGLIFGYFCSGQYHMSAKLAWFLHNDDFFKESLALCGIFLVLGVLFTLLSRRITNTSVIGLVFNQIVEYAVIGVVVWFSYDYLIKDGNAFFQTSDAFIKWYIYGLWILVRQSAFYLLCIVCFWLFYERRPKFADGNYICSEEWFAKYLADNYRGPGVSVTIYGLLFAGISLALFEEGKQIRESYYMAFAVMAVAAVITLAGLLMVFFALFPKLLGSFRMIYKGENTERMIALLYKELEEERPLVEFEFGRGLITRNFIVLYLPMRVYYIPFCRYRKGTWFYFSDGRKFFVHECDARLVRGYVR